MSERCQLTGSLPAPSLAEGNKGGKSRGPESRRTQAHELPQQPIGESLGAK